jgi:predicted nucleic acid-binding protein
MNGVKVFFDTNVLLYMYSKADPDKQARAQELFRSSAPGILVSTQVVQEFYVAGSRKLGLPLRKVQEATAALLDLPLVTIGPPEILAAMSLAVRYRISFWDALVVAAAESGGAHTLYTEDLNHGQRYGAVQVSNPFRPSEQ